jgi:glycosyltransferase involved in cell wall biosynthesis
MSSGINRIEQKGTAAARRDEGKRAGELFDNVVPMRGRAQAARAHAPALDQAGLGFDADLVCLSHLRWDFVYQRPQHLLTRCARGRRVFFFEEPVFGDGPLRLDVSRRDENLYVVVPRLPEGLLSEVAVEAILQAMIDRLFADYGIKDHVLWYYTPMAVGWTRHLKPLATVFDCMDELSAFKFAPRALVEREAELFGRADVVFTGGQSLYEAKRDKHTNVHAFPSSIDRAHFAQARARQEDPEDQAAIPRPRMGFFGVVDERFDTALLDQVAEARPDWQFVIIGPVVKISESDLPRRPNIHYLGPKSYAELPRYVAGWDVAALPFARNESTRFISPTKTPEYLAAGKPVVSTPIRDVMRPYGELGLVRIAEDATDFIRAAAEIGMDDAAEDSDWLRRVDEFLARSSWDETWGRMEGLIGEVVRARRAAQPAAQTPTQRAPLAPLKSKQAAARTSPAAGANSFTAAD